MSVGSGVLRMCCLCRCCDGVFDLVSLIRATWLPLSDQTACMAIRYGVQADSEEECAEGLALLADAGFVPVMLPKLLTDGRWLARAVPGRGWVFPAGNGEGVPAAR